MQGTPLSTPATISAAEVVYLHGQFLPRHQAHVDIEDRGFLFADGAYEVIRYYWGLPLAMAPHQERLTRSLAALNIKADDVAPLLPTLGRQLLERNRLTQASIYWQVTRGSATRGHAIPPGIKPTVMAIAYLAHDIDDQPEPRSMKAHRLPDLRWARCDIKSLMLLPNVLAKSQATEQGADEAILIREGIVTEGGSTTVLAMRDGQLWTHPANARILNGITRQLVLKLAGDLGLPVVEQPIPADALPLSQEVMAVGTTTHVAAITQIDGRPVGDGAPGPVTRRLFDALMAYIRGQCRV